MIHTTRHLFVTGGLVLLAATSLTSAPSKASTTGQGDFVCVRKWGVRFNEGYCGRVEQIIPERQEARIRVTGGDGTTWRTQGTICSEGLNIKRLRIGQIVQVPLDCIE